MQRAAAAPVPHGRMAPTQARHRVSCRWCCRRRARSGRRRSTAWRTRRWRPSRWLPSASRPPSAQHAAGQQYVEVAMLGSIRARQYTFLSPAADCAVLHRCLAQWSTCQPCKYSSKIVKSTRGLLSLTSRVCAARSDYSQHVNAPKRRRSTQQTTAQPASQKDSPSYEVRHTSASKRQQAPASASKQQVKSRHASCCLCTTVQLQCVPLQCLL